MSRLPDGWMQWKVRQSGYDVTRYLERNLDSLNAMRLTVTFRRNNYKILNADNTVRFCGLRTESSFHKNALQVWAISVQNYYIFGILVISLRLQHNYYCRVATRRRTKNFILNVWDKDVSTSTLFLFSPTYNRTKAKPSRI